MPRKLTNWARRFLRSFGFDVIRTRNQHGSVDEHLANLLHDKRIDCVIDVGANAGQYGQMLRRLGYTGTIISFEPVSEAFQRLKLVCDEDPDWHCHQLALGEKTETKLINVYSSTVFSSFLEVNDYSKGIWKSLESGHEEQVQVRRLDDILDDCLDNATAQAIMLKLDTQGFDHFAFRGAQGCLDRIQVLQSELSAIAIYEDAKGMTDLMEEYRRAGFAVSGLYPINRDASMAIIEFDSFYVRLSGHSAA